MFSDPPLDLGRFIRSIVNMVRFLNTLRRTVLPRCSNMARMSTTTCVKDNMLQTPIGLLNTTQELCVVDTTQGAKWPVFRLLQSDGKLVDGVPEPTDLNEELAAKMYSAMVQIQTLDEIMMLAQRQGRISFYMQAAGEEAIHIGSASVLDPKDMIFSQYREQGVLLWRGFTVQEALDQCFSNEADLGKGRQMPVHYGSAKLNFQTISSPLATQLPQAVGAAYAYKLDKADAISVCYFGEGAASEGDFHAALNFSATLEVPIVFFCRNNGYAISTPSSEQYRGDGIASRAVGYGIHAIRVDGNDLLAVRAATAEARRIAHTLSKPVLIEAMTYRAGHHSTSDDSTRYRGVDEIKEWQDQHDPLDRFRQYMLDRGWWDETKEKEVRERERQNVLSCMEIAEKRPKPAFQKLFEDVYAEKPAHILKQEQEMFAHIAKFPEHYTSDAHH